LPEIFQLDFMVRAFIAGGFVGVISPTLGTFLVLRRLSLIADTLAHVALAGVAIGLLLDRFPVFIATATTAVGSLIIERLRTSNRLSGDAALALVLYTALATAVVIISVAEGFNVDLFSFLFGGIVTVKEEDIWAVAALGGLVVLVVALFYRELVQSTFDPDLARTSGVKLGMVDSLLAVLTGVSVTLAMRVVGALLVGALIVFPVLAALQVARSFRTTLLLAACLGVSSVFAGLTISFYQDVAPGGTIVLVALGVLMLVSGSRFVAGHGLRG